MMLERADGGAVDLDAMTGPLEAAFIVVMRGVAENDGYNALVLTAGMLWRDVALIRTISRFLRQIRVPYSQDYMWATLRKHGPLAVQIVRLFHTRFDPAMRTVSARSTRPRSLPASRRRCSRSRASTRTASSGTSSTRCSRRSAPISTSSAPDGQPKPLIAIKFDSRKLDGLPLPRPLYEIFVYSPRVEGVHLRFGKVARGGIRWSDRPQDFRTEVLGLVKAQQVKNAVIVPVGAKGGFVPKHLPVGGPRDAIQAEGIAAYKLFIATLARHHRQSRRRRRDPAGRRGAARRRRSLSRGRRRQGHRDLLRHRQRHFRGARLLARRRLRVRRLGRLRPQGDGHHRPRRLGGGEAPLPRDGRRYHAHAVHRGRRRRHVGRRVRQRHAARDDHQARRRLRPSRHLHRSRSRSGKELRRAGAAVRAAALELAGLRQVADLRGRRHLPALLEGDRAVESGAGGDRLRQGQGDAAGGDERDPQGAGRSAVLRRHRHLRARLDRNRRDGGRPRQRSDPHHRRPASRQGGRRGRQSRHDPARPRRGGVLRRAAQHRRDRQLRRRQHLRRRGQHQDRAQPAGGRRPARHSRRATRCSAR